MDKRIYLLIVSVLILTVFVSGVAEPKVGIGSKDANQIQNLTSQLPINSNGKVDFDNYKPFWTKADEKIATINGYIGPISKAILGVELSLSWIFAFSVILWVLLVGIIMEPVSEIFGWNLWWSLAGSAIIATLAMQGFGSSFVLWINSIITQWYIGAMVVVGAVIFGAIYSLFMRYLGEKVKNIKEDAVKTQTEQDRMIIHADANVAEEDLKSRF